MKYNNEPLMFINTVNTKNKLSGQCVYDSRKKSIDEPVDKPLKEESNEINNQVLMKLSNMIKKYEDNLVVIAKILLESETIICIPVAIKEGRLIARKIDSEEINIDLEKIVSVEKIPV